MTKVNLEEALEADTAALSEAVEETEDIYDEFNPLENLPVEAQKFIKEMKVKYEAKGMSVWTTSLGDKTYAWRPLLWPEYKEIQRSLIKLFPSSADTAEEMELRQADRRFANMEQVITKCVIYPDVNLETIGYIGSGAMHTLYDNIAEQSGFGPEYVEKV